MAEWRQLMKKVGKIKTDVNWNKKHYHSKGSAKTSWDFVWKYFIKACLYWAITYAIRNLHYFIFLNWDSNTWLVTLWSYKVKHALFDTFIYCNMITTVALANTSIKSQYYFFTVKTNFSVTPKHLKFNKYSTLFRVSKFLPFFQEFQFYYYVFWIIKFDWQQFRSSDYSKWKGLSLCFKATFNFLLTL